MQISYFRHACGGESIIYIVLHTASHCVKYIATVQIICLSSQIASLQILQIHLQASLFLYTMYTGNDMLPTLSWQRDTFSTPAYAIFKTMAMSTGEIDFDPNFHISRDAAEPELPFLPVTAILWIIFISVMPILYVNMLVSYAYPAGL